MGSEDFGRDFFRVHKNYLFSFIKLLSFINRKNSVLCACQMHDEIKKWWKHKLSWTLLVLFYSDKKEVFLF